MKQKNTFVKQPVLRLCARTTEVVICGKFHPFCWTQRPGSLGGKIIPHQEQEETQMAQLKGTVAKKLTTARWSWQQGTPGALYKQAASHIPPASKPRGAASHIPPAPKPRGAAMKSSKPSCRAVFAQSHWHLGWLQRSKDTIAFTT